MIISQSTPLPSFADATPGFDSGKWRIEGSSICVEWQRIQPSCSEARAVGDKLYIKRANNGEIVLIEPS